MFTLSSKIKHVVGRCSGRAIEAIPEMRVLAKRSAFAAFVALAGFGFSNMVSAADVGLAWNANPETDIAKYRLSYGTSSGQYTQVKEVGRDTRTLVTNLEAGRTYYFAVSAVNYAGMQSDLSAEVSYQTPPLYFNLNLAWNPNPETDISAYRLSYGTSSGQYNQVVDVGRNTRATVSNLEQGKTYYFAVTAVNYAGMVSDPSIELIYNGAPAIAATSSFALLPQASPTVSSLSSDTGSVANVLNSYLGADSAGGVDAGLSPTASNVTADPDGDGVSESYLVFSYRRAQLVASDSSIAASVEVSRDLVSDWQDSSGLPGVVELVEANAAAPGVDIVRVYLPTSLATNGRLFARLAVSQLAP
jgi:YHS domain-containing protein